MESDASATPEQWGHRYREVREKHVGFTGALERLMPQLLDRASISYAQIEGRTKEVDRFVGKLERKREKYENPLQGVTDLVGLRVVLFYLDDVERVGALIREQFEVDLENSGDKSAAMDPDRFGYLSVHYIVQLLPTRSELPEWSEYGGLYAEIQVRTVLQHAWAAISRKLAYANVHDAPADLQRNLNRLSALFELADDEFLAIREARKEIEAKAEREIEQGKLQAGLVNYLENSDVLRQVEEIAREAGSPAEASKTLRVDAEVRHRLQQSLRVAVERAGLRTVAGFERTVESLLSSLPSLIREVNARYLEKDGKSMSTEPHNWLTLTLLWSIRAMPSAYSELGYVDDLIDVVTSTYPSRES
jgi:GTP pyrophosphokinase